MSLELSPVRGELEPWSLGLPRWVELLKPAAELGAALARTEFVPKEMRGRPEAVAAAILLGDELGLGPMEALSHVHVVEGKPTPSSELMRALILRAGHEVWVEEATDSRAVVAGRRRASERVDRVEWTLAQARTAGLVRPRSAWQTYPRPMLVARATAELARRMFPDAIGGLSYLEEELSDSPAATEAPPRRVNRRSSPTSVPAKEGQAAREGGELATPPDSVEAPGANPGALVPTEPPGTSPDESPTEHVPGPPARELPLELPNPPEAPSKAAVNKAHALLNAVGIKDRTERLKLSSLVCGREVTSWSELDAHEVSELLDVLDNLSTGLLALEWHDGAPVLTVREEPQ